MHRWNREAIAKVRNDEKEHAEKTEITRQETLRTDAEARLDQLRARRKRSIEGAPSSSSSSSSSLTAEAADAHAKLAGRKRVAPGGAAEDAAATAAAGASDAAPAAPPGEHINFFADIEHAMGQNEEHAKEKAVKDMQEMKRLGIAPLALGDGASEASESKVRGW